MSETLPRQRLNRQEGQGPTLRGTVQAGALGVGVPEAIVEPAEGRGRTELQGQAANTVRIQTGASGVQKGERAQGLAGRPAHWGNEDGAH